MAMLFTPENPMTPIIPAWLVIPLSCICLRVICLFKYSSPEIAFFMLLCSLAVGGTSGVFSSAPVGLGATTSPGSLPSSCSSSSSLS